MNYTIHICERTERGFYIVASGETNSPARQGFLSFLESQEFDVDQCGSVAVHDAHGEVDVFQNRNRDFALHIFFTDIL